MSDQPGLFAAPPPVAVIEQRTVAVADCDHCRRARAGLWGGYYSGCMSCRARLLARSLAAFDALGRKDKRDARELREATARALDSIPYTEARELVLDWFNHDRKESQA